MSKAGRERQRERAEKRQATLRRKERRRKLRNYAIIGLVLAMLGALFAAAAIADANPADDGMRNPMVTINTLS